jgi:hypothetical protein
MKSDSNNFYLFNGCQLNGVCFRDAYVLDLSGGNLFFIFFDLFFEIYDLIYIWNRINDHIW